MRKTLDEITLLRGLAILFVIAIHVLNLPVSDLAKGSLASFFYFAVRAGLIFAVPCFLFMSMLMISYPLAVRPFSVSALFKKRAYRILVPFLLWSGIYLALSVLIGKYGLSDLATLKNWAYWLFNGKAWEHLYFIPILVQLIILTPLLLPLARLAKDSFLLASLVAIVPQIGIYWLNKGLIYDYYPLFTSTAFWYYYIGFLGLWFGLNYEANLEKIKHILPLLGIMIPCYFYYVYLLYQGQAFNTFYYTIILDTYITLMVFGMLYLARALTKERGANGLMAFISANSFGIYLVHPMFLLILRRYLHGFSGTMWLVVSLGLTFALALICAVIVEETKCFKWLYGEK